MCVIDNRCSNNMNLYGKVDKCNKCAEKLLGP